jgi:hypothetical protein
MDNKPSTKTLSSMPLLLSTDRETPQAVCSSGEDRSLLRQIKAFLRGFPTWTERASDPGTNLHSSLAQLSSVTTPNGPWVYTVVPWED